MQAIQTAYRAEAPRVIVRYNFGASGALAQQISQGAPVDVFLSASPQWMEALQAQNLLEGQSQPLLNNRLVLVTPASANAQVEHFEDLATGVVTKIAIGEPESVPAGRYGKETLTTMGLWDTVGPKLVFGKSARQVLAYVETGNVDAGLVYATDLLRSDRVEAIATVPADAHSPIVYPVAIIQRQRDANEASGTAREAARAFVAFLSSQAGQEIFNAHGFDAAE